MARVPDSHEHQRRAGRSGGRLPDFIVIGATKAGTTSLDFYLSLHPEIHMARPKEPCFFVDVPPPRGRWELGIDWYRGLFVTGKRLCGESSPAYAAAPTVPGVPERMASVVPNAKLVYLVREPFERLRSAYLMAVRDMVVSGSFAEYLEHQPKALQESLYGHQYLEYARFFPAERILVLETRELERNRRAALAKVFRFLGADDRFSSPLFRHRRNVGSKQRFASAAGRRLLCSRPMLWARASLHSGIHYHLRNLALLLLSAPPPSTSLPASIERRILARLREDVGLLRSSTGLALPSLDPPPDP